jgi:hypothetical protein
MVGNPSAKVQTTYELEPGSHSLEITTTVENRGEAMLALFGLSDLLYHGRTLRYAPGAGLMPMDKRSSSTWLSFFWQDCAWGVVCSPLDTIEGIHEAGVSELRYAVVDIPPGESRMYRRSVVAAAGGPERVWQTAYPLREYALSGLGVALTERDTGTPVPNGEVLIKPDDRRSPVLLVTDSEGEAQLDLHAGRYFVAAAAAGRVPAAAATVNCASGQRHRLGTPLSRAALATVRVRAKIGEFFTPTAARVSCYLPGRLTEPFPPPSPFPLEGRSGVVLADGTAGTLLPLAAQSLDLPSRCFVTAYRGPLFDCAVVPVAAVPGRTVPVDIALQRQVDPGQYLALDLRQHSDTSLDCALTLQERELANACEGLDAAVLSDPALKEVAPGLSAWVECCLIRGLRLELDRVGSFSVYPVEPGHDWEDELWRAAQPGQPLEDVLRRVRKLFPDAVVQLDHPLDERFGYLTACGLGSGGAGAPPPTLSAEVDAVEVLSGRNVAAARGVMTWWFGLLNSGSQVVATGGSGSRTVVGVEGGSARTFVHCPAEDATAAAADIVAAVRRLRRVPNAFVTNGPFVDATLNGQPIGSRQSVEDDKVHMALRIRAPLWIDVTKATVYCNGEVAEEIEMPEPTKALRCDRVLELDVPGDCWFVVVVEGERPLAPAYGGGSRAPTPFAVTNPFWVDADGDGEVHPSG